MPEEVPKHIADLLTPIDGGFHVRDRADGNACIDVMQMLDGWRIVRSTKGEDVPEHTTLEGGWDFFGTGLDPKTGVQRSMFNAQMRATMVAVVWDGYEEPSMYDRNVRAVQATRHNTFRRILNSINPR